MDDDNENDELDRQIEQAAIQRRYQRTWLEYNRQRIRILQPGWTGIHSIALNVSLEDGHQAAWDYYTQCRALFPAQFRSVEQANRARAEQEEPPWVDSEGRPLERLRPGGIRPGALTTEGGMTDYAHPNRWVVVHASLVEDVGPPPQMMQEPVDDDFVTPSEQTAYLRVSIVEPVNSHGPMQLQPYGGQLHFGLGNMFEFDLMPQRFVGEHGQYEFDPEVERFQRCESVCMLLLPQPGHRIYDIQVDGCTMHTYEGLAHTYRFDEIIRVHPDTQDLYRSTRICISMRQIRVGLREGPMPLSFLRPAMRAYHAQTMTRIATQRRRYQGDGSDDHSSDSQGSISPRTAEELSYESWERNVAADAHVAARQNFIREQRAAEAEAQAFAMRAIAHGMHLAELAAEEAQRASNPPSTPPRRYDDEVPWSAEKPST